MPLRLLALVPVGALLVAVATPPPAAAHVCGQVRADVNGNAVGVPACHEPGVPAHTCFHSTPDPYVGPVGLGASACAPG